MADRSKSRGSRPLGVTLIAILQVISALQMLAVALIAFIIASIASTPEVQEQLSTSVGESVAGNIAGIFLLIGIIALAIAIFSLILARGYIRGREWARRKGRKIAVFAILLALLSLILIPSRTDPGAPIWTIFLNSFIFVYLGRRRVRKFFR